MGQKRQCLLSSLVAHSAGACPVFFLQFTVYDYPFVYSWVESSTARVNYPSQVHNAMTQPEGLKLVKVQNSQ